MRLKRFLPSFLITVGRLVTSHDHDDHDDTCIYSDKTNQIASAFEKFDIDTCNLKPLFENNILRSRYNVKTRDFYTKNLEEKVDFWNIVSDTIGNMVSLYYDSSQKMHKATEKIFNEWKELENMEDKLTTQDLKDEFRKKHFKFFLNSMIALFSDQSLTNKDNFNKVFPANALNFLQNFKKLAIEMDKVNHYPDSNDLVIDFDENSDDGHGWERKIFQFFTETSKSFLILFEQISQLLTRIDNDLNNDGDDETKFMSLYTLEYNIENSDELDKLIKSYNLFSKAWRYGSTKIKRYQDTAVKLFIAIEGFLQMEDLRNYLYTAHFYLNQWGQTDSFQNVIIEIISEMIVFPGDYDKIIHDKTDTKGKTAAIHDILSRHNCTAVCQKYYRVPNELKAKSKSGETNIYHFKETSTKKNQYLNNTEAYAHLMTLDDISLHNLYCSNDQYDELKDIMYYSRHYSNSNRHRRWKKDDLTGKIGLYDTSKKDKSSTSLLKQTASVKLCINFSLQELDEYIHEFQEFLKKENCCFCHKDNIPDNFNSLPDDNKPSSVTVVMLTLGSLVLVLASFFGIAYCIDKRTKSKYFRFGFGDRDPIIPMSDGDY